MFVNNMKPTTLEQHIRQHVKSMCHNKDKRVTYCILYAKYSDSCPRTCHYAKMMAEAPRD